ncbi:RNA polymerase sigma factor [Sorangium cellulosum]|uniref:RNA polymerase sigma factor n=1 Tax=Sorangium cellulosum TaxID=56 RepID=UPI001650DFB9|nr:sigma-70 family RNA polymerase sigma factor [Sorangium cellulosum]
MRDTPLTTSVLTSALGGEIQSLRSVIAALTPVIHARVGRALHRRFARSAGGADDRLDDLVQDVFVELFRDGSRALRAWDPARGLSLANWVGLIADQRVAAALRRWRRHPEAAALPLDDAPEEGARSDDDPEARVLARDALERPLGLLRAELSPLGRELLEALLIEEEPIAAVCARTGMSTAAVQAWSSRLKRRLPELAAGGGRRAPGGRRRAMAADDSGTPLDSARAHGAPRTAGRVAPGRRTTKKSAPDVSRVEHRS